MSRNLPRSLPIIAAPPRSVELAQEGDIQAFNELMRAYSPLVHRIARGIVRRPQDVEDVAQETWLTVAQQLPQLEEPVAFQKWLGQITRRRSLDWVRSRAAKDRRTDPVDTIDDVADRDTERPEEQLLRVEAQQSLFQALGELGERDREALYLRVGQGLPYREISRRLGISESAVGVALFRARDRLRRFVDGGDTPNFSPCGTSPFLLTQLVDDSLPEAQSTQLATHLEGCTWCSARVEALHRGESFYRQLGLCALPAPATGASLLATGWGRIRSLLHWLKDAMGSSREALVNAASRGVFSGGVSVSGALSSLPLVIAIGATTMIVNAGVPAAEANNEAAVDVVSRIPQDPASATNPGLSGTSTVRFAGPTGRHDLDTLTDTRAVVAPTSPDRGVDSVGDTSAYRSVAGTFVSASSMAEVGGSILNATGNTLSAISSVLSRTSTATGSALQTKLLSHSVRGTIDRLDRVDGVGSSRLTIEEPVQIATSLTSDALGTPLTLAPTAHSVVLSSGAPLAGPTALPPGSAAALTGSITLAQASPVATDGTMSAPLAVPSPPPLQIPVSGISIVSPTVVVATPSIVLDPVVVAPAVTPLAVAAPALIVNPPITTPAATPLPASEGEQTAEAASALTAASTAPPTAAPTSIHSTTIAPAVAPTPLPM